MPAARPASLLVAASLVSIWAATRVMVWMYVLSAVALIGWVVERRS